MGEVVELKRQAIKYIYSCIECHSTEFRLHEGGEVECNGCGSYLTDCRHFNPNGTKGE